MEEHNDKSSERQNWFKSLSKSMKAVVIASMAVPALICVILFVSILVMDSKIDNMIDEQLSNAGEEITTGTVVSEEDSTEMTTEETSAEDNTTEESTTAEPETDEPEEGPLPEGKYAYLTFDDGPSSNTEAILDILDQYGVKATFFVNGRTGETNEARYKAIVDRGHALGLHTYTHNYDTVYGGIESFANEVESLRTYLYNVTGVDTTLFRFPGGSSNTIADDIKSYIRWINDNGYSYHDWNCSNGDATGKTLTVQEMIDTCMVQVNEGYKNLVILMHDANAKDTTVEALPMLIEKLIENGYEIRAIDERSVPVHHREAE